MVKLYYCTNCKKIQENETKCKACNHDKVKQLQKGTSVNVIGTKTKGYIYKIKGDEIHLSITSPETKERYIKEYKLDDVRKVL